MYACIYPDRLLANQKGCPIDIYIMYAYDQWYDKANYVYGLHGRLLTYTYMYYLIHTLANS